jgi:hypothetical protein
VATVVHEPRSWRSVDALHGWIRHQLFLAEGSERDRVARALVEEWSVATSDGVVLDHQRPVAHGVVSWEPR